MCRRRRLLGAARRGSSRCPRRDASHEREEVGERARENWMDKESESGGWVGVKMGWRKETEEAAQKESGSGVELARRHEKRDKKKRREPLDT